MVKTLYLLKALCHVIFYPFYQTILPGPNIKNAKTVLRNFSISGRNSEKNIYVCLAVDYSDTRSTQSMTTLTRCCRCCCRRLHRHRFRVVNHYPTRKRYFFILKRIKTYDKFFFNFYLFKKIRVSINVDYTDIMLAQSLAFCARCWHSQRPC